MSNIPHEFTSLEDARREIVRLREIIEGCPGDGGAVQDYGRKSTCETGVDPDRSLYHIYNDLLLAHTPNMIFLFDENHDYVIGSKACRRLTRRDGKSLNHCPFPRVFAREVDPEWIDKVYRLNQNVFESGTSMTFRDSIKVEGDDTAQVYITISPMMDDAGQKRGTIMAINDVVELVTAQHQAEEIAAARSRFLANMSHEIRTPMNAIKALSELLAVTQLTDTQRVYVKNVIASSNSLISIINDVLDYSKIDANRLDIVQVPYGLEKLIAGLCGVIALRAEEKGLRLLLDVDPRLPSQLVGDDNRIRQVLLNLLSNAIKYTQHGHVVFRVTGQAISGDSLKLCFSVEDTGIGVRSEDMPLLFDAFSRVDLKANRSIQGTGLGLSISKHLSEAMNGSLSLQSVYGKGSTFMLTLPQEVADATPLAAVDVPEDAYVLLVGTGDWVENAAESLRRMWVEYAVFAEDAESDAGLLELLADPAERLIRVRGEERQFSHCIYSGTIPMEDFAAFRKHLPGCRFALIRSLLHDIGGRKSDDVILFHPLMITELSKFLNKRGTSVSGRFMVTGSRRSKSHRFHDALALVVDDNRINLMVCEKMLNIVGVSVMTASSGFEALELSEAHRFDIIFVDHMMPGMDGIELASAIRGGDGLNRNTPIIALTANVDGDMRSGYLESGMSDFVGKPIDRLELSRVLREWLPEGKVESI